MLKEWRLGKRKVLTMFFTSYIRGENGEKFLKPSGLYHREGTLLEMHARPLTTVVTADLVLSDERRGPCDELFCVGCQSGKGKCKARRSGLPVRCRRNHGHTK